MGTSGKLHRAPGASPAGPGTVGPVVSDSLGFGCRESLFASSFILFKNNFSSLSIAVLDLCSYMGFDSSGGECRLLCIRGTQASDRRGFSRSRGWGSAACGLQLWQRMGSRVQAQQLWWVGLLAPQSVGSSQTRVWTHVSCMGRQIPYHCATREALILYNKNLLSFCEIYCALKMLSLDPRYCQYMYVYLSS